MLPIGRAVVVAAHPDDEILGIGGTMAKFADAGLEVTVIIVCQGRPQSAQPVEVAALQASDVLGVRDVRLFHYPNLQLDTTPLIGLTQKIEAVLAEVSPSVVFTHHYGDVNRDHQRCFEAVLAAVRPVHGFPPPALICFETPSSSEWSEGAPNRAFFPNLYVNISDTFRRKMKSLRAYHMEMREYPHPRSYLGVQVLAQKRGMTIGVQYAEAFQLIRGVIP